MTVDYVSSSNMHVFAIRESREEDGGDYTVLVTNPNGSVKHTVSVNVGEAAEYLVEHSIEEKPCEDIRAPAEKEFDLSEGRVSIKSSKFGLSGDFGDDLGIDLGDEFGASALLSGFGSSSTTSSSATRQLLSTEGGFEESMHQIESSTSGGKGSPILLEKPEPVCVPVGGIIRLSCKAEGQISILHFLTYCSIAPNPTSSQK